MECSERIFALSVICLILGQKCISAQISPQAQSPGMSSFLDENDQNYAEISAPPSPDNVFNSCETTTFPIYDTDLIGMPETGCDQDGIKRPYGISTPFGISWEDDSPKNCTIISVTILIHPGQSCGGASSGGLTMLNNYSTPVPYRFPFANEYNSVCQCPPQNPSATQVFNFHPKSAYNQSGYNQFLIYNSTGSNGLREIVPNATESLYGLVIINQWQRASDMKYPRSEFGFVGMPNGKILAAGGITQNSQVTDTGEEYDPIANSWNVSANRLSTARSLLQVACLNDYNIPDSKGAYYIMAAGGTDSSNTSVNTSDIYNTSSQSWITAPAMKLPRAQFTLTSVYNDTKCVVAVGGLQGSLEDGIPTSTAELYSWGSNKWNTSLNNMTYARYRHQTTAYNQTYMLVLGGQGPSGAVLSSVEYLSLKYGEFSLAAPMQQARYAFTATRLKNQSILVVGGANSPSTDDSWQDSQLTVTCELFTNGVWTYTGNLTYPRAGHQAVLMDDGSVLVTGGSGSGAQQSSEIWIPDIGYFTTVAPLPDPKLNFGVGQLQGGRVLAFGGSNSSLMSSISSTSTSFMFTQPFTTSDAAPFTALSPSPSSSQGPASQVDSYRAPPIAKPPPAPPSPPSRLSDQTISQLFAGSPLPANASVQLNLQYGSDLSAGAIGGIVGGIMGAVLLIILIAIWYLIRRRRRRRAKRYSPEGLHKINTKYGSGSVGNPSSAHASQNSLGSKKSMIGESLNTVHLNRNKPIDSPFGSLVTHGSQISGFSSGQHQNGFSNGQLPATGVIPGEIYIENGVVSKVIAISPYSEPNTALSTYSGNGVKNLGSIDENTTTSGGSPNSREDLIPPCKPPPNAYASSVELSGVSFKVRNELVVADWKIDRPALRLEEVLGRGGFGEVFRGQHHGSPVAIKVLEINDEKSMHDACHEFGHLHNLRHSKLVISYGACIEANKMMLVMELMEEDLFHAIAKDHTGSSDSVLWNFRGWQIAVDIASALTFLHSQGRIHLDLKSLNILLRGKRTEAKLGDLGLARMVPDGHLALQATLPGTPAYSAPEVIQAQLAWRLRTQGRKDQFRTTVGTPADIFSFGVVLFEICTGLHPARWRQDFSGTFRPEQAPQEIANLVDLCLHDEPEERPCARKVLDILLQHKPCGLR